MIPRTLRMTAPLAAVGTLVALVVGIHKVPVPVTLRIESLSHQVLRVQVTSTPPGLWLDTASSGGTQPKLVVTTPSALRVADSVQTVEITVLGRGAVQLHLEAGASPQRQARAIWGRDITLRRGEDGQFRPVAKVFPLIAVR